MLFKTKVASILVLIQFVHFSSQYSAPWSNHSSYQHDYDDHHHEHEEVSYTPAPSGHTPKCASKSKSTFCDHIDDYPKEKIRSLLSGFNVRDFVIDEAQIDFVEKRHDPQHKPDRWSHGKYLRSSSDPHRDTFQDYFSTFHARSKRQQQQPATDENLCTARTSYVNPQAAMNSRGNWMYLVNGVDSVTQQIRAETCSPGQTQCSTCQLPNRYTSRCQQKYAQKRLVALNSDGERLYTDTFWFPSCCVCVLTFN